MGRAARCLLFIYLFFFFLCVSLHKINYSVVFFFIIIYLNYSAQGCGRIPFPWDFPLGRDKKDSSVFFCFVFSLRQQMSSFSNYNGPREPFFSPLRA